MLLNEGKSDFEPEELVETFRKYQTKKQFFFKFVEKMIVVDPMDREIIGPYVENQALLVSDLVEKVQQLKPIHGSKLSIPLNQYQYIKLKSLFEYGFAQIGRCGEKFLDQAKASKTFYQDFKQIKQVKDFNYHIEFFA